jgi:hypothetical protein
MGRQSRAPVARMRCRIENHAHFGAGTRSRHPCRGGPPARRPLRRRERPAPRPIRGRVCSARHVAPRLEAPGPALDLRMRAFRCRADPSRASAHAGRAARARQPGRWRWGRVDGRRARRGRRRGRAGGRRDGSHAEPRDGPRPRAHRGDRPAAHRLAQPHARGDLVSRSFRRVGSRCDARAVGRVSSRVRSRPGVGPCPRRRAHGARVHDPGVDARRARPRARARGDAAAVAARRREGRCVAEGRVGARAGTSARPRTS